MANRMEPTQLVKRKFEKMTEEHRMLGCSSVVVALSGGVDSVVLLHLMKEACRKRQISLSCLHVHHGIRGDEADRDADFCQKLCEDWGIDLETVYFDVPAIANRQKRGLEEVARDCRYGALSDYCMKRGVERIATAHNADDNLETLLFHLIRGAGTTGGGGIAPVRGGIIRPILSCTKEEILGYAAENGIAYVEDSTNADPAYSRNYLRHRVIPMLRELNPNLTEAALRFCRHLREDDALLGRIAAEASGDLSCESLAAADPAICRRIVRSAYTDFSGGVLSADQTDSILELIQRKVEGSRICLPGGNLAVIRRHRLCFEKEAADQAKTYRYNLRPGVNPIPEIGAEICLYAEIGENEEKEIKEKQNIYKLFIHRSLDFDKIAYSDLVVRNKSDGDRIRYGGITRRVKKLLWERKIPTEKRGLYPVVSDADGIVWIPGFPVCDRAAASEGGKILHLCFFADPFDLEY